MDIWLDETAFRDLADGRVVILTTGQRLRLRPIPWERLAQAVIDAHKHPAAAHHDLRRKIVLHPTPWDDEESC